MVECFLGVLSVIGTAVNFGIAIVNLIIMVLSFLLARHLNRRQNKSTVIQIGVVISAIICILSGIGIIKSVCGMVSCLFNPKSVVLKAVLKLFI